MGIHQRHTVYVIKCEIYFSKKFELFELNMELERRTIVLFLCFVIQVHSVVSTAGLSEEHLLIRYLMKNYEMANKWGAARPVAEHYHKIGVGLDLSLRDIFHIDLKGGQIGIRLWETFRWQDVLLAWRRSDFQGIDNVRVPM